MDQDRARAVRKTPGCLMGAATCQTLIIGGGLSGLALAEMLQSGGNDYVLVEARDRIGGRIVTEHVGAGYFDMGPAWIWPGQPRIAALFARLGLVTFDQFAQGHLTQEDEHGRVVHGRGTSSMQGSWRVKGGFSALAHGLWRGLPDARKRLRAHVTRLEKTDAGITATLAKGETITARNVVLCMPPRIAATITYTPALPDTVIQTMQAIPTWMAGQAKAVAVYDTPFWREAGLSGDAMSRRGPMVEIHDASPAEGGPYALFGFIGVPPQGRRDEQALRAQLQAQLIRLFGPMAAEPRQLYLKDWAFDRFTATQADLAPLYAHPTYGVPPAFSDLWHQQLSFAGTEVAPQFGGYMEGALEVAENACALLTQGGSAAAPCATGP